MGARGGDESLWRMLRRTVRVRDCLALAAVPAVVVAVFYWVSEEVRRQLAFEYADPSPVTAFTAHYVHFGTEHLAANVLGFVLLAGAAYLLAVLAGRRRLFGAATVTYLGAFPFVLSALNLALARNAIGYGISGVNMAFAGLLGVLLVAYARERVDARVRMRYAPAVFFVAAAVVSVMAIPMEPMAYGLASVCVLGAAGYVFAGWRGAAGKSSSPGSAHALGDGSRSDRWLDVGVLAAVVFVGGLYVAFPQPSTGGDVVVNLYVHLLGFCLGFLVPYVAVELGAFASPPRGSDRL
jgi:hypothetical protein